jgi:transposase InsO family protein
MKAEDFPVTAACEVMAVSTSAFYAWRARAQDGAAARALRDAELLDEIRTIHKQHPDCSSPRMTHELRRRGKPANHKKVEAMMAANGIVARRHRRRRSLTKPDKDAPAIPDLVGRLFDPDNVDHTWVGDVSCVATDEGWLYLACVLDLGSRRLLGYSMSETPTPTTSSARSRWRSPCAAAPEWTARSSTPTAGRPTPRPATAPSVSSWGCASRSAAPDRVSITPWRRRGSPR